MRVWLLALAVLSACGRIAFDHRDDASTDVATQACTFGPWSGLAPLAGMNSTSEDFSPSLSADSLTLVFSSARPAGGPYDLYMATRASPTAAFDPPLPLTALNTAGPEQAPSITFDGLTIYYASNMTLHRATRTSQTAPFTNAMPVPELAGVTLLALEITAAGDELFFTRGTAIERATYAGGTFTLTGAVPELAGGNTCCPTFTHDGLTVYVASDRAGNMDIYSSSRAAVGAPFGTPTPVAVFNTLDTEDDPDLSDDGTTLLLAGRRSGDIDIYESTRVCE